MKRLLALALLVATAMPLHAQHSPATSDNIEVSFGFRSRNDKFFKDVDNNEYNIEKLFNFIDTYKAEINSGKVKVYVSAYSADYELLGQNLNISKKRASQVKSFIIIKKGLRESNFVTSTFAARKGYDPTVTVSITVAEGRERLPMQEVKPTPRPVQPKPAEPKPDFGSTEGSREPANVVIPRDPKPTHKPAEEEYTPQQPKPVVKEVASERVRPVVTPKRAKEWSEPYIVSIRTNLAYYALLVPNIGFEVRPTRSFGIKLAGGYSDWGWTNNNKKQVMNTAYLNAELRWYMGNKKRFYLGAAANAIDINANWGLINTIAGSDDRGYDGLLYNAGLVIGYQAKLSNALSMDFNIGGGYTQFTYDEYIFDTDGDRVDEVNKTTKALWPIQAEVALVWRLGRNRK